MEFEILNTTDAHEIHKAASELSESNIREISLNAKSVVVDLEFKEFLFLMSSLSIHSTNFENNLCLIDLYLNTMADDNLKLSLENALYSLFLKKYENEDCFNLYFEVFSRYQEVKKESKINKKRTNSIWFFTLTPVFLAHTNAMFTLLETRTNTDIEVTVASLGDDANYRKKCSELNVNFVSLAGENLVEKYESLVNKSQNALALCWNGPPVHLDYISKRTGNAVYWTHRFHPNLEHVNLCISAKSPEKLDKFYHYGKEWKFFDTGFTIKNWKANQCWDDRRGNFGSFCRETLIDNSDHWRNVSAILTLGNNSTYHYAGRKRIHDRWCKTFNIDIQKVNFLGWLDKPEQEILRMAFLLDSQVLGQGLMGMEAIAGKIPIIQPNKTPGFYENFMRQVNFKISEKALLQKVGWTVFHDQQELLSISSKLFDPNLNSKLGQLLQKKFHERDAQQKDFNYFIELIETSA